MAGEVMGRCAGESSMRARGAGGAVRRKRRAGMAETRRGLLPNGAFYGCPLTPAAGYFMSRTAGGRPS